MKYVSGPEELLRRLQQWHLPSGLFSLSIVMMNIYKYINIYIYMLNKSKEDKDLICHLVLVIRIIIE